MESLVAQIKAHERDGVIPIDRLRALFVSVGFRATSSLITALAEMFTQCGNQPLTRGVLMLYIALQQQHYQRPPKSPLPSRRMTSEVDSKHRVFLGGSCNPTTWRKDLVIPKLQANNITFFNPQVDDWYPELIALEATAKEAAELLFFVVDNQTRGIASLVEVASYAACHRNLVVVQKDFEGECAIDGVPISNREIEDLNRGRAFLAELLYRCRVPLFEDISEATDYAISLLTKGQHGTGATRQAAVTPLISYSAYLPLFPIMHKKFLEIAKTERTVDWTQARSIVEYAIGCLPPDSLNQPFFSFDDVCLAAAAAVFKEGPGIHTRVWTPPCLRPFLPTNYTETSDVFLGGSCGKPSWRFQAIEMLNAAHLTYFNPEVPHWSPALIIFEMSAQRESNVLLYVIDGKARGIGSMVEVAGFIAEGRPVVLMVQDIPSSFDIDSVPLAAREIKDLNRGRAYLIDAAKRHGTTVMTTLTSAIESAIALASSAKASAN